DNPDQIQAELDAIRALTREDVVRVFETYIKDKPAVVQSVVPAAAPDSQTRPDNYTLPSRISRVETTDEPPPPRDITSAFDRSIKPEPAASPLVTMPEYWETSLDNGIEVIGTSSAEVPIVNLRLVFTGGHLLEDPASYG